MTLHSTAPADMYDSLSTNWTAVVEGITVRGIIRQPHRSHPRIAAGEPVRRYNQIIVCRAPIAPGGKSDTKP